MTKRHSSRHEFFQDLLASNTAQRGGGSFKDRKPTGEVSCCDSWMAEQTEGPKNSTSGSNIDHMASWTWPLPSAPRDQPTSVALFSDDPSQVGMEMGKNHLQVEKCQLPCDV